MAQFTAEEAEKLKIPLEVLQKWEFVMNTIWSFMQIYSGTEKAVRLQNKKNTILFKLAKGHQFVIQAFMVNNSYISLNVTIKGNKDFDASINLADMLGKEGLIRVLSNILTYAENIK